MTNYRKIYKEHHGAIPKDENGRTFDIHHIDGDRTNNKIENLIAVSIQQHYDIHLSQKDYGACMRIGAKMKIPHQELSKIARERCLKQVEEGIHPWLGGDIQRENNKRRVEDGSHNFLGGEISSKLQRDRVTNGSHNFLGKGDEVRERTTKAVKDGTYHMLGPDNPVALSVRNGTHNFITNNPMIEISKNGTHHMLKPDNLSRKKVEDGTHNFLGGELQRKMIADGVHPCVRKVTCPHCGKVGNAAPMGNWHFDKCKHKL